ncbi:MAG: asparagine synthase-related protein [Streptosporangiaceae bacterium]
MIGTYFTLAISAATRQGCAGLIAAALGTDPRVLPIPGPAAVAWRAPDERAAVLTWGLRADHGPAVASHEGTIWAGAEAVHARTGPARVDPVYLTQIPGAVLVCDRASWAAAVAGASGDHDPVMIGAFLSMGYAIGAATPFRGVRALGRDRSLTVAGGRPVVTRSRDGDAGREDGGAGGADRGEGAGAPGGADPYEPVAAALVDAVAPLRDAGVLVELSLTGGKDSRLIAAALTAAKVPFRARTHGSARHPDVVIAAMIAERLGVEHVVTEPKPPGAGPAPDEASVIRRLRSAVLVSDGTLSAFENVGWPDPQYAAEPVQVGGHGGELLRGGYAAAAWRNGRLARVRSAARAPELFRRLTTRRLGLLRPAASREYLAALAPYAARLPAGPLRALDDFYLINRAGRWSATARQGYLMRSPLVQPFFADRVVRAARSVPLEDRITDRLHRGVLAALRPDLLELPLAGSGWKSGPTPGLPPAAPGSDARPGSAAGPGSAATGDWRRNYGDEMAGFLRDYALDMGDAGGLFDTVRRPAAEAVLRPPHADAEAAWALATLAALTSGDWRNAREPVLGSGPVPDPLAPSDDPGRVTR